MFPTDVDFSTLIENTDNDIEKVDKDTLGKSLAFDYDSNTFVMVDGANKTPSKIDSIKQWIELFIRTELNKYPIYSDSFGVDLSDLVGYRLPRAFQVAEIERRITDGILNKCPNVVKVSQWDFDKGHFSFTVTTNTGEEVKISE